eukprot:CAMPEP_0182437818 /NCGR_PEP_ID=MMETSP1167-20130531/85298_1 /TAXON_ID=2988 /ORGANISM="Mallomonas Sp, Strain CCMP3275" /LENGTH=286 /DNA_ID=CAMNT_0024630871 /DNA_START=2700 /DNA_END=3557 /DNA_ORIENTATION=-
MRKESRERERERETEERERRIEEREREKEKEKEDSEKDTKTPLKSSLSSSSSSSLSLCCFSWTPSDGAAVVDVSCGARHTVCVDELGRVWGMGDNRFGQLGMREKEREREREGEREREKGEPVQLIGLEKGVKWRRVQSGWSHSIVRGVRKDGSLSFYGWGRKDMGQLPSPSDLSQQSSTMTSVESSVGDRYDAIDQNSLPRHPHTFSDSDLTVQPLSPLPQGSIREVWCGGESTICCCEQGYLWSSGWNAHGNLGCSNESLSGEHEEKDRKKETNEIEKECVLKW